MSKQTNKMKLLLSVAKPVAAVEQGEEDAKEGEEPAEAATKRLNLFGGTWVCACDACVRV